MYDLFETPRWREFTAIRAHCVPTTRCNVADPSDHPGWRLPSSSLLVPTVRISPFTTPRCSLPPPHTGHFCTRMAWLLPFQIWFLNGAIL